MGADGQTARDSIAPATVVVVGLQFTVPHVVNYTVTSIGGLLSPNGHYEVKDTNDNLVFKVKGSSFNSRCLLLDATADIPLLTVKQKAFSWHEIWRVFRGESTNSNDLLFSVRKTKIFKSNTFDVVLAANTNRAAPRDFKIIVRSKKCSICIGESDETVAHAVFFARDKLEVVVNPNVDYAFIVSLMVILEEIDASRLTAAVSGVAAGTDSAAAASGC